MQTNILRIIRLKKDVIATQKTIHKFQIKIENKEKNIYGTKKILSIVYPEASSTKETPKPSPDLTPKKPSELIEKSHDSLIDEERIGSEEKREALKQKGLIYYLPVLFGAILVFMISRSQNLDYNVWKLIWATFVIGKICEICDS